MEGCFEVFCEGLEEAGNCAYTGTFRGGELGVLGLDVRGVGGMRSVLGLGVGSGLGFGLLEL